MSASMAAAKLLRQRCVNEPVEMAVLLGTGLRPLSGALEGPITVSYQDLSVDEWLPEKHLARFMWR
jgi:hypothetical protein